MAQSMEYMLSENTGVLGSSLALFALKAAIQCYQYRPGKELRWLQETVESLSLEKRPRLGHVYALAKWSEISQARHDPKK